MKHTPLEILKHYWKYDSFRPLQEDIVRSVMEGHDTLALLPTGGGKSICYQVPALAMDGICVVVSPLIALMKDQVDRLRSMGIKAACIYSGMRSQDQMVVLNNCVFGKTKLLYVSPERLRTRVFVEHYRQMKVSLLAVDEAHCISQWGYDFRPTYREIAKVRPYHEKVPVLALTATATPEVVEDICRQLDFGRDSRKFQSSFARPNLSYIVVHDEDKIGRLLRLLKWVNGCSIVYVDSRRNTQEIASLLSQNGIPAISYHAGLDGKTRDQRQQAWMSGKVGTMVATNAFGMGIDKPDVRAVVHLSIPMSPEYYFQEAGRAGRDGKRSYAVLLYKDEDLQKLDQSFAETYPSMAVIRNVYNAIGNYFNVPIGSGEGCEFDFDLLAFCRNYCFSVNEAYSALRFLGKEGLVDIPEREETSSQLKVLVSREDLYRYMVENKRYGDLINVIVRTYGGLFTDYVDINEKLLASKSGLDVDKVEKYLLHLDALEIWAYKRLSDKPRLCFLSCRIDARDVYISEEHYGRLKQYARGRLEAMKQYVSESETCRSISLLRYFGEHSGQECGDCDVCRSRRKSSPADLKDRILKTIGEKPQNVRQLADSLCSQNGLVLEQSQLVETVREMLDHYQLRMDADFTLRIP